MKLLRKLENGQGLVEYALIIALISVVCVTALKAVADGVDKQLNSAAKTISDATAKTASA